MPDCGSCGFTNLLHPKRILVLFIYFFYYSEIICQCYKIKGHKDSDTNSYDVLFWKTMAFYGVLLWKTMARYYRSAEMADTGRPVLGTNNNKKAWGPRFPCIFFILVPVHFRNILNFSWETFKIMFLYNSQWNISSRRQRCHRNIWTSEGVTPKTVPQMVIVSCITVFLGRPSFSFIVLFYLKALMTAHIIYTIHAVNVLISLLFDED